MASNTHRQQALKELGRLSRVTLSFAALVLVLAGIGLAARHLGEGLMGQTVMILAGVAGLAACFFFLRWIIRNA